MKKQKRKENVKKGTGRKREYYPMEDRALKEAARFMGEELLPLLDP
ncbi:MAG: hypothetical protein HFG71_14745 [Hungatella sp.]|nr:hypothetical protein [Hungatella sp.]